VPDWYNGFVYLLEGSVSIGAEGTEVSEGQVAWMADVAGESSLRITAGDHGARLMLYAGERQNVPIVMHGPFVAESRADLMRLSKLYFDGKMPRVSELAVGE
jgi:redox-sensitive bicupin YhaK (pirin superfamily)